MRRYALVFIVFLRKGTELIAHALTEDGETVGRHGVWIGMEEV